MSTETATVTLKGVAPAAARAFVDGIRRISLLRPEVSYSIPAGSDLHDFTFRAECSPSDAARGGCLVSLAQRVRNDHPLSMSGSGFHAIHCARCKGAQETT